jgi:23S rRNA pseudouridine955/2504/2580 synthase
MKDLSKARASWVEIGEEADAQRIDNFLLRRLKGVPKSHVYRVLRSGQVRVNSARVGPDYRLRHGDRVRLPPVRGPVPSARPAPPRLDIPVLYEDDALLVLDKPPGLAVHGGSGISFGVIERVRSARPQARVLELAHRLDRDTSGVLMLAKKRGALLELHRMLREGEVEKLYVAAVKGAWNGGERELRESLHKYATAGGERRVSVHAAGVRAVTRVRPVAVAKRYSLLEARLVTGRTHQIRVHLAHAGHPILGDEKYGDRALNAALAKSGLRRLLLHARRVVLRHPASHAPMALEAPLPPDFERLAQMRFPDDGR